MPFQEMMRSWVNGECASFTAGSAKSNEFKDWWLKLTESRGTGDSKEVLLANEDALEFLIHLRRKGNDSIECAAGFRTALRSYVRKTNSGAAGELWDVTNEVLKGLSEEKEIRLVHRANHKSNRASNSDIWALSNSDPGNGAALDVQPDDFKEVAQSLWYSTVQNKRKNAGGRSNGRLVSPSEAKLFLMALLNHYKQPMAMGLLNDAMALSSPILVIQSNSSAGEDNDGSPGYDPIENAPAYGLSEKAANFILFEAGQRGGKLGSELCRDKLCSLFVGYYLQKKLRGEAAVLAGIDGMNAQRNAERVELIGSRILKHLPFNERPDDFVPDDVAHGDAHQTKEQFADNMATTRLELFTLTLELAGKFCAEKCSN
jgi:hypothetical protein